MAEGTPGSTIYLVGKEKIGLLLRYALTSVKIEGADRQVPHKPQLMSHTYGRTGSFGPIFFLADRQSHLVFYNIFVSLFVGRA